MKRLLPLLLILAACHAPPQPPHKMKLGGPIGTGGPMMWQGVNALNVSLAIFGDGGFISYDGGPVIADAGPTSPVDGGLAAPYDGGPDWDGGFDGGIQYLDAGPFLFDAGVISVYDAGVNPNPNDGGEITFTLDAGSSDALNMTQYIGAYISCNVTTAPTQVALGALSLQESNDQSVTGWATVPGTTQSVSAIDGGSVIIAWDQGGLHAPSLKVYYGFGSSDGGSVYCTAYQKGQ